VVSFPLEDQRILPRIRASARDHSFCWIARELPLPMRLRPLLAAVLFWLTILLPLRAWGQAPAVSLTPDHLAFAIRPVGTTSPPQSATLTNIGTAPLSITSMQITGFSHLSFGVVAGGDAGTLAPGESRTISITFTPTAAGDQTANLIVNTNASNSPHQVQLTGGGTTPSPGVRLSPPTVNFGTLPIGATSPAQNVMLTNISSLALTITAIGLSGSSPGSFAIASGGDPGTLAAGASRTIRVTFTPATVGGHNATLFVTSNAPDSPHSVSLIGSGANPPSPPAGVPAANVSPTGLTFGSLTIGSVSAAQTVTVTSAGTAPLLIQSVTLAGTQPGDFRITAGDPGTVAEGASLAFGIAFAPTAAGPRSAMLVITDNAPGSPVAVSLSGSGAVAAPAPLSTDWPVFGHDPRQLGLTLGPLDPTTLAPWSVTLGSRPGASPVVRGGVAYIGSEAGGVFAVDVASHAVRWNRPLPDPVRSAPAAGANVIVVSAHGLYGLSPGDGSILWQRADIVATEDVSPMLVDDTVYLGAHAATGGGAVVYAVNAATGANVWPAPVALPAGFEDRATAAVYPELGLLFLGLGPPATTPPTAGPSAVMALRMADGSAAWDRPAALPAGLPPTALSLGWTGAPARPVLVASIAADLQPAVFVAAGANVTALHAVTGAMLWNRALPETALQGPPVLSSPAPEGATLYVGGASGKVYALSSSTGADAPGGLTTPVAPITGPLALVAPYLYVPTTAGLLAIDAASGAERWSSPLSAASGVAVAGGVPYVATSDTRLVGFSVPPPPPPAVVHDLTVASLQVAPRVSRRANAVAQVTIANHGTATESYSLLVRVQPGVVLLLDRRGSVAAGQTVTESFTWRTAQMGDDGPKALVAQVTLLGQTDRTPADNNALQIVTVGP
jgi:outer membrane protein assembly factor BamB